MNEKNPNKKTSYGLEIGLFCNKITNKLFTGRPALFLDRDGVIVEETNYLHLVKDIKFIPQVANYVARANQLEIAVILVTNQSGIGRGYYKWHEFESVQKHIQEHYQTYEAQFDLVMACAYHSEGIDHYRVANHSWRKPNSGMLIEAASLLQIDLSRSFIVGDSLSDLAAGATAGLHSGALVETGHGKNDWELNNGASRFAAWRASGRFTPLRASDAAAAIEQWICSTNTLV